VRAGALRSRGARRRRLRHPAETPRCLAWWLADLVLAQRLRLADPGAAADWAGAWLGVPFRRHAPADPAGSGGVSSRRCAWPQCKGVAEACRQAAEIARRATRLETVTPKLRTKGAGEVIQMLLDDDAVPGTLRTKKPVALASRRLFERLTELEAVRELSGRATFRLFGL